ncbi:MAG: hypothetical protein V3V19_11080 [Cocleimonas sp.]
MVNSTEGYKQHRQIIQLKAKTMTKIFEGLSPKGWMADVLEVCKPEFTKNSGNRTTIKSLGFDLLRARFDNEQ